MPAYTFEIQPAPQEPGQLSNFGNMRRDGSRQPLGSWANGIQTTDATGTPQKSPLTVSNSATTRVVIPVNAVSITLIATTNTVNVSELSTLDSYFTIPTGAAFTFDCGLQTSLYLKANTGAATVSFVFNVV